MIEGTKTDTAGLKGNVRDFNVDRKISVHNKSEEAHADIREKISNLSKEIANLIVADEEEY